MLPPGGDSPRSGVSDGPGVGQGDGATGRREVPQAHGFPQQPAQPASPDQQPCGANQPHVSLPGEGAVQMAAPSDSGTVCGVEAGRSREGVGIPQGPRDRSTEIRQTPRNASPSQPEITASRMRIRWRSVRSVAFGLAIGVRNGVTTLAAVDDNTAQLKFYSLAANA